MTKKYWIAIIIIIMVVSIIIYRKELKKYMDKGIDAIVNYAFASDLESHLKQLHPKYQNRFRGFFRDVKEVLGWNVIATSSYRTFAEQARLHSLNTKNAVAGYSTHNYGLSMDINLQKGTTYLRKTSPQKDWEKTGIVELAKKYGLDWGGNKFVSYYDPVHFEVTGVDTKKLRALALAQFGTDNSKIQGNRVVF
jgi:ribosomal protein S17E